MTNKQVGTISDGLAIIGGALIVYLIGQGFWIISGQRCEDFTHNNYLNGDVPIRCEVERQQVREGVYGD